MCVGELLRGFVLDFGEDYGGERRSARAGRGSMLGKNRRTMGYARAVIGQSLDLLKRGASSSLTRVAEW